MAEIAELESDALHASGVARTRLQAKDDVKARIEDRMKRVRGAYHLRGARLSPAWSLAKKALAA